jgi:NitT/TauT family transport system ATP-binding protein
MRCAAAQVDGFCVGEPWNSVAVESGTGVIAALVSDIWPGAAEKVLGMRADYAAQHPDRVRALVRSIGAASRWTQEPGHLDELAAMLSEPRYVGVPERLLRNALTGDVPLMTGVPASRRPDFLILAGQDATVPAPEHAAWFCSQMQRWGQVSAGTELMERARASFRSDLYRDALQGIPA